jgi:hypothetical protein
MTVQDDLPVAYHQQDTDYYCGAACAQMVLNACGEGLLDQDLIYTDNHAHSLLDQGHPDSPWYTGPDGLLWTLNNLQNSRHFTLNILQTEDEISRMLVWAIHDQRVAPIALVGGWDHWIVVRGYTATEAPVSSADTSYTIQSFDVWNPFPPVPGFSNPAALPPPAHDVADGCAGRAPAGDIIPYSTWQSSCMTPVPGGLWKGRFIAVAAVGAPAMPAPRPSGGPMAARIVRRQQVLAPEEAIRIATIALETAGLAARAAWNEALRGSTAQEPVLVQRLDRPGQFYYIVPFGANPQSMSLALTLDAFSGEHTRSVLFPAPRQAIRRIDVPAMLEQFSGYRFEAQPDGGFLTLHPNTFTVHPTWVWMPCRESLSPYYPFMLIQTGTHRLYQRIDGQVFTMLHTNYAGL